jgi:pSer/pThr/pTyr-binding forkhead associated (FHA) protein
MVTSDGSSSQLFFARADATIGRDPANEVHLEDSAVSARHARFCYHHGQWWVEDLNSTNGTFLNSERLKIPAVVMTGDLVRCGEVTFTVSLPGETVRSDQHPAETVRLEIPQQ